MIRVRIYCGDDSVDIELPEEQYWKLLSFVNRQENMEIYNLDRI